MSDDAVEGAAIAVIGMAGRFPGAKDVRAFWSNLRHGVESIKFFTDDELLAAGESPENLRDPSYVRAWAQLADIDKFDAAFFGMSPRDAAVFDPQHRFFLEVAWSAFEDAGYVGEQLDGPVAVFAACGMSEYMIKNVLTNAEVAASVGEWLIRHTGNDTNFLATRVSYELDLRGPSMNVQTACSSSLVAIHLACQSLLNGECDLALAGGSTISAEQHKGYLYKEGEILSPDGHCRAFDAKSAGTTTSSATGGVILKRLSDARRDGDNVLAIIRGSAVNNDGNDKVGYLAPSVSGQARVVAEALAVAGVEARDVSYVEAHGTGTLIGDPIEIAGITQAFRQSTDDAQFCAIGSTKTNIGHAGEAAGVVSFIKTVLALMHREIPPSLHYEEPNPQADFASSPFFVNAKLRAWTPGPTGTRIAGVTGLGAGGTNAHVVLEEAPARVDAKSPEKTRSVQLLTISAKTLPALDRATVELVDHLRAHPSISLADVAFTRLAGRKAFRHRRAIAAATVDDAIAALDKNDPRRVVTQHHKREPPKVVFMFPGGGAQYAGMGRALYEREPVYRRAIDACAELVNPKLGLDLRALLYPKHDVEAATKRLERPSVALPALFATEYAMGTLLESWGIVPAAMIGHSAGEYAAACLAGVISMADGLALVSLRGRLFETLPEGGMLSVSMSEADARARMPKGLSIAASNAPALCVVSGPIALIAEMERALAAEEIECTRVHIDVAAHSSMLEPILAEFGAFCRTIRFSPPKIPYVSNLTGAFVTDAEATDPSYWVSHLRQAVRFGEGVEAILQAGDSALIELGPGRTLSSLARQAKTKASTIAPTIRHPKEEADDLAFLFGTLARVWAAGVSLDASKLYEGEARRRLPLPTYPFERLRYWIDPGKPAQNAIARGGVLRKRADVGSWFYTPSWRRSPPPKLVDRVAGEALVWLVIADRSSLIDGVIDELTRHGDRVVRVSFGARFVDRDDGYVLDPTRRGDWDALFESLRRRGAMPQRIVHASAIGPRARKLRWRTLGVDVMESLELSLARDFGGLVSMIQALAHESDPLQLTVVTRGVHAVVGEREVVPERALLNGVCRVVAREFPHISTLAIDLDGPIGGTRKERKLVERVARELASAPHGDVVAFRDGARFVRRFDEIALQPAAPTMWMRARGVYLITGGLGGIGLTLAEHLVREGRAKVVLIGRTPLPPESSWASHLATHDDATSEKIRRVQVIRALADDPSDVLIESVDVTDRAAMERLVARVHARHGLIHGVFHAAGVLRDQLIALRPAVATSEVIDTKVKGALVLDEVLANDPLELFVLFSSVSSILGLPGQVDYTAANAFLDAFAIEKSLQGRTRAVVVDWNAWQEVGMAVSLARQGREQPSGPVSARSVDGMTPLLEERVDDGDGARFTTSFSRKRHWLLAEHVVRGGEALIPGTGFLELARSAVQGGDDARAIEIRDLFFLAPFVVRRDEVRALHVQLDRRTSELVVYSESETTPHVSARVARVDAPPAERHDLAAIRARCSRRTEHFDGFAPQAFMDFGPRWGSLRRIDWGDAEALVSLQMPDEFVAELATHRLHPALLDVATGSAQRLIPGFSEVNTFYVPFSYGRVLVRRALPAKLVSHVRYRPGSAKDLAVFDVTLCDELGDEVASIEGFAMRRIADGSVLSTAAHRPSHVRAIDGPASPPHARSETPLEAALREGILPREGMDALDRILGADVAPQIVASSIDLHAWLAQVDAEARVGERVEGAAAGGPQFERPSLSTTFAEPRTKIERELSTMWRELLGVEQVGIDDDFFELGGQSLIAVRLFGRIRKKWGVDLPLSTLFEAPSIAQCAAVIADHLGIVDAPEAREDAKPEEKTNGEHVALKATRDPTKFRSLVMIQRGGDRAPFFCVHGAGGNVLNFRDLSRAMDRAQPFYGLQARGVDGVLRPQTTVEEMARTYLDEIRGVQPRGPYLLGGYSGGGLVAFEMAQLLTAVGERVDLLAFFDTFHPQMPLRRITMKMRFQRLHDEGLGYVRRALDRKRNDRRAARELQRLDAILARDEPVPSELRELHLTRAFEQAAPKYTPKPWAGKATLFRAEEVAYIYRDGGPTYGWSAVISGGVDVVAVPGNHDTLLLEPNASILMRALGAALLSAQRSTVEAPLSRPRVA